MDRPLRERLRECVVDEAGLLDERESVEGRARNDRLKVVTGSRSVVDGELVRVEEKPVLATHPGAPQQSDYTYAEAARPA